MDYSFDMMWCWRVTLMVQRKKLPPSSGLRNCFKIDAEVISITRVSTRVANQKQGMREGILLRMGP